LGPGSQTQRIIISDYYAEGTMAKTDLCECKEIITLSGQKLPLKMYADDISFSTHTHYQQTNEFIRILKPSHVVSVHGE
jgi:predicted metal-dependent RNase